MTYKRTFFINVLFLTKILTYDILCSTIYYMEAIYMNTEEWKSQIKRGTLEFAIMLMIKNKPTYGYEIISLLEKHPLLSAKENTIYPLLRRLLKAGYITSSWQESSEGLPPRKYYSITELGEDYIREMCSEWDSLTMSISEIRGGKVDE